MKTITITSHWNPNSAEKTSDEVLNLLELRSQNYTDLHVEEVKKEEIRY